MVSENFSGLSQPWRKLQMHTGKPLKFIKDSSLFTTRRSR